MKSSRLLLTVVVLSLVAAPVSAGIFFHRRPKQDPGQVVSGLIFTLKTEQNEHKRAAAAEQLRHFDPNLFPEIVPVLIDAALHDPKAAVRADAVQSLGRIRPVSQQAGWALEQVLDHDGNIWVRLQARTSLWQYHLAGYHGVKSIEPSFSPGEGIKNTEPPLAVPVESVTPAVPEQPMVRPAPTPVPTRPQPPQALPVGRPLPTGPAQPPVIPAEPPKLKTAPSSDGPDLAGPD